MRIDSISWKQKRKEKLPLARNINEPIPCSIFVLQRWNFQKSICPLGQRKSGQKTTKSCPDRNCEIWTFFGSSLGRVLVSALCKSGTPWHWEWPVVEYRIHFRKIRRFLEGDDFPCRYLFTKIPGWNLTRSRIYCTVLVWTTIFPPPMSQRFGTKRGLSTYAVVWQEMDLPVKNGWILMSSRANISMVWRIGGFHNLKRSKVRRLVSCASWQLTLIKIGLH